MQAENEHRPRPPTHATGTVEFVALADIADDETFRVRAVGDVAQLATSMGRLGQLAPIELRELPGAPGDAGTRRWQVVSGFRRLAAARLLARERVLARLHDSLSDHDAWGLALGEALLREPLTIEELEALRERLRLGGMAPWAEELVDDALERLRPPELEAAPAAVAGDAGTEAAALAEHAIEGDPPVPLPAPPAVIALGPPADPGAEGETIQPTLEASTADGVAPAQPAVTFPDEEVVEVTPEELVQDVTARLYALNQDLATAFEAWEDLPVDGRKVLIDQIRYTVAMLPLLEAKE